MSCHVSPLKIWIRKARIDMDSNIVHANTWQCIPTYSSFLGVIYHNTGWPKSHAIEKQLVFSTGIRIKRADFLPMIEPCFHSELTQNWLK